MIPFFPKQISYRAIIVYLISLALVSVFYFQYAMSFGYMVLGVVCVVGFFLLTNSWTQGWARLSEKQFIKNVFILALSIRLVWVVASYFYYTDAMGTPFGFEIFDAVGYHETAVWLAESPWSTAFEYFFNTPGVAYSDAGYPLYLTVLYKAFGPVVIIPRLLKALISAYMCVLIYRIGSRTFGEETGRMAMIMCALMPNFIFYCGYHLKEPEMIFLEVAFLERLDYMIRSHKFSFWTLFLLSLITVSLFLFRTVLGAAALFAAVSAVLFSSAPAMKKGYRRFAYVVWGLLGIIVFSGGSIAAEIEYYWEERGENASNRRYEQTLRGNQWAQYATGAVMAPMIFVLPFSTMVDVGQTGQLEKHGGNFIRNFMGFFTLIAIFEAFRRKKWRDFTLIGAFVVAYLGIIALSGFSNSERFLLPGMPGLILMWAYGVSALTGKTYKLLTPWCIIVVLMEFAWAFFKLGSRGLF